MVIITKFLSSFCVCCSSHFILTILQTAVAVSRSENLHLHCSMSELEASGDMQEVPLSLNLRIDVPLDPLEQQLSSALRFPKRNSVDNEVPPKDSINSILICSMNICVR